MACKDFGQIHTESEQNPAEEHRVEIWIKACKASLARSLNMGLFFVFRISKQGVKVLGSGSCLKVEDHSDPNPPATYYIVY